MAKPGTPRTLEELRAIYGDEPDADIRARVERLWLAVEYAEGRGITASKISEAAGATGHLSHVFAGRRRNLDLKKLKAYARETGVSETWLVDGIGTMLQAPKREVVLDSRYPNQDFAAELLRREAPGLGFDPEVVELAILELRETAHDLPHDVGPLRWFEKLRARDPRARPRMVLATGQRAPRAGGF